MGVFLLIFYSLALRTLQPKSQDQRKKNTNLSVSASAAKVNLLCYRWQNSQCGIRTLSSDNASESQHGSAFTGRGHTLLSVSPCSEPARELVINRGGKPQAATVPHDDEERV